MGHSSLLGTDLAPARAPGHDAATLGPGDSSDSGSDMAGLDDELESADADLPVDVALRDDAQRVGMPGAALGGSSDASGTGERSSAGVDGGRREAADISTDRVFGTGSTEGADGEGLDDDEDPDLAFVDEAQAGDVYEDEPDPDDAAEEGAGARPGATAGGARP